MKLLTFLKAYRYATPERIVFVTGPSPTRVVGSGMHAQTVGGREGYAVYALDAATGAVVWRSRI